MKLSDLSPKDIQEIIDGHFMTDKQYDIRKAALAGFTECPNCAKLTYNIDLGICDECDFTD